jgi:hypothetical protein
MPPGIRQPRTGQRSKHSRSWPKTAPGQPPRPPPRPDAAGLTGTQRTGADACARYLTSKDDYLRYDQALTAGWPIATGVIEGACRHLIGDRPDITGARWGLHGAEAILTPRAVIANGDNDDYRRYHMAREHQRLYPGTAQGQHTLSA